MSYTLYFVFYPPSTVSSSSHRSMPTSLSDPSSSLDDRLNSSSRRRESSETEETGDRSECECVCVYVVRECAYLCG